MIGKIGRGYFAGHHLSRDRAAQVTTEQNVRTAAETAFFGRVLTRNLVFLRCTGITGNPGGIGCVFAVYRQLNILIFRLKLLLG